MADKPSGKCTKRIVITGIVQGVGFRPFVYRLAVQNSITGYVKNASGSVEVVATGNENLISVFVKCISISPPKLAIIKGIYQEHIPHIEYDTFSIVNSDGKSNLMRYFPVDSGICETCESELYDEKDKRFGHYFNNCVTCGPRYSVLLSFPYDRTNTSMSDFSLCQSCANEYTNPDNIRFHAETISCHNCGPKLYMKSNDAYYCDKEAFKRAIEVLHNGEILAIKGIGGYHYACMPTNSHSIEALRIRKGRDEKPFAVMFKNVETVEKFCHVDTNSIVLLTSHQKPIVLLPIREHNFATNLLFENANCGCLLPYSPLHKLIMEHFDYLVMTSANSSSEPIVYNDDDVFACCTHVLLHNRKIIRSVEDSVVQVVNGSSTQCIRLSRGYAPLLLDIFSSKIEPMLAMGGDLKASYSIYHNQTCTISPYCGDLESAKSLHLYQKNIRDWISLFEIKPKVIICDAHPNYISYEIAQSLSAAYFASIVRIFHHHAHIASVIAENNFSDRIIGVAFDGTGYGTDGCIWGGEIFICNSNHYKRIAHLDYTKMVATEMIAKNAKMVAECYVNKYGLGVQCDDDTMSKLLRSHYKTHFTSSIGRLFDGVCSLIGLHHYNDYEGQCASLLQQNAEIALKANESPTFMTFLLSNSMGMMVLSEEDVIRKAIDCAQGEYTISSFALGFHIAIAQMVEKVCTIARNHDGTTHVALSGGVFQNKILLEMCIKKLEASDFTVLFNTKVPPNDGGIALGQTYIATREEPYVYSDSNGNC